MNDKKLYRVPEAMAVLSLKRSVLYELPRSGRLRSVHEGRTRLVPAAAITEYIALFSVDTRPGGAGVPDVDRTRDGRTQRSAGIPQRGAHGRTGSRRLGAAGTAPRFHVAAVELRVRIEQIARLLGHRGMAVTERVYRHELRPVLEEGVETMDVLFPQTDAG